MRKLSKGRLLGAAAAAALALSAGNRAMASFQYEVRLAGTSHGAADSTSLTLTQPGTYNLDVWAIITNGDNNLHDDGPSTDTLSIYTSPAGPGSAIADGGISGVTLGKSFNKAAETFPTSGNTAGKKMLNDADTVGDWGSTDVLTKPEAATGWIRYKATTTSEGGNYMIDATNNDFGDGANANAVIHSLDGATEWRVLGLTVTVNSLSNVQGGKTVITPVSGDFSNSGVLSSYGLSYYNDDPGVVDGTAIVKKSQLAPIGFTFINGGSVGPTPITLAGGVPTAANDHSTFGPTGSAAAQNFKATETNGLGTVVRILNSSNQSANVTIAFRNRAADEKYPTQTTPPVPARSYGLISDSADVTGFTAGDVFVIDISYDPASMHNLNLTEAQAAAAGMIYVASLNPDTGMWENTVLENNPAGGAAGSPVLRAYDAGTDGLTLGLWGVDTTNHTAWAIVNHNSQFAVVPEPAALGLMGLASLGLLARRRNRKA